MVYSDIETALVLTYRIGFLQNASNHQLYSCNFEYNGHSIVSTISFGVWLNSYAILFPTVICVRIILYHHMAYIYVYIIHTFQYGWRFTSNLSTRVTTLNTSVMLFV